MHRGTHTPNQVHVLQVMGLCASAPARTDLSDSIGESSTACEDPNTNDSMGTAAVEISLDESTQSTRAESSSGKKNQEKQGKEGKSENQEKGSGRKSPSPTKRRLSLGSNWELLRGNQKTPEFKKFAQLGMGLVSHEGNSILHSTEQPLTVTFRAPPRVDANAVLEKEGVKGAKEAWVVIKDGALIKQRPLAQKIVMVATFPKSGKYRLSLYCKEAGVAGCEHELGCRYLVRVANKTLTVEPAPTDPVTVKTSPRRHKPTTSFRATSLTRVDSAASPTGENIKKMLTDDKAGAVDLQLDTSTEADERLMSSSSHVDSSIIHKSSEPLAIILKTHPGVECEAVLRVDSSGTASNDGGVSSWEPITGIIQVWPRPMAQKTKVVTKFPQPGKFELRIFVKDKEGVEEGCSQAEFKLGWRYIVEVSKKTVSVGAFKQTQQSSKMKKNSYKSPGKSPGMHLSDRKKVGSSGRRETKMSLW